MTALSLPRYFLCWCLGLGLAAGAAAAQDLQNLGLAASDLVAARSMFAFLADEEDDGGRDLNGDGDASDRVVHVYDLANEVTLNLGYAATWLSTTADYLAFTVAESAQGTDLNGDGDLNDNVPHLYDHQSGDLVNLGRSATNARLLLTRRLLAFVEGGVGGPLLVYDIRRRQLREMHYPRARYYRAIGRYLFFEFDSRVHFYDVARDQAIDTGLRPTASIDPLGDVCIAGGLAAISASERETGRTDLNGDGDIDDRVLQLVPLLGGPTINTGLAVADPYPWAAVVSMGDRFLLRVFEADQDLQDLNGDGDVSDFVLHAVSPAGVATNLGLALAGGVEPSSSLATFTVAEYAQGAADLNGDGDTEDEVVHYYETVWDVVVNTGLAAYFDSPRPFWRRGFALVVREERQGKTDLNRDGDSLDDVQHLVEVGPNGGPAWSYRVMSSGLAVGGGLASVVPSSANVLVVPVSEADQGGTDLDGDGLLSSYVLVSFRVNRPRTRNRHLSILGDPVGTRRSVAALAWEARHGDLNGDGDAYDLVVHVGPLWRLPRP